MCVWNIHQLNSPRTPHKPQHKHPKQEKGIRKTMVEKMREEFKHLDLTFSIGGQISFDLFPKGWDKTYCLRYLDAKARGVDIYIIILYMCVYWCVRGCG